MHSKKELTYEVQIRTVSSSAITEDEIHTFSTVNHIIPKQDITDKINNNTVVSRASAHSWVSAQVLVLAA